MIRLKRIYEPADPEDGARILVERLWPRGVKREEAKLAAWVKELAPSPELRKWFAHRTERWKEFRRRYEQELQRPLAQALLQALVWKAHHQTLTLVFAAKDVEHNSAVVIQDLLRQQMLNHK